MRALYGQREEGGEFDGYFLGDILLSSLFAMQPAGVLNSTMDLKRGQAEHLLAVHKFREGGGRRGDEVVAALGPLRSRWQAILGETRVLFGEEAEPLLSVSEWLPSASASVRGAANWNLEEGCKKKFKEVFGEETVSTAGSILHKDEIMKKSTPLPVVVPFEEWTSATPGFTLVKAQTDRASPATSLADAIAQSVADIPQEASAILVSNLCAENCATARDILQTLYPNSAASRQTSIVNCLRFLADKRGQLLSAACDQVARKHFIGDGEFAARIDEEVDAHFLTKSLSSLKVSPPLNLASSTAEGRKSAVRDFNDRWPAVIAEVAKWEHEWLKSCGYISVWEPGKLRNYTFDPFAMRGTLASRFETLAKKLRDMQDTQWNALGNSRAVSDALSKAAAHLLLKDIKHTFSEAATAAFNEHLVAKLATDQSACANAFAQLLLDMGHGVHVYGLLAACYNINLIVYEDARHPRLFAARNSQKVAIVSKLPQDIGFSGVCLHNNADSVTAPMKNTTLQRLRDLGFELPHPTPRPQWLEEQANEFSLNKGTTIR